MGHAQCIEGHEGIFKMSTMDERILKQIDFIVEIDKLKEIVRQTYLMDGSHREDDAEHSWHIAMMALVLAEHANAQCDMLRVIKMLLIHDIVEIDAGDAFIYDDKANEGKGERERMAARRIFNILPGDQAEIYLDLWREFEDRKTPESLFANSVDRLEPILQNYYTKGKTWQAHDITPSQVLEKNRRIADGSEELWAYAQQIIRESQEKGYFGL
jgi:putative hydrolases of HD superfamily